MLFRSVASPASVSDGEQIVLGIRPEHARVLGDGETTPSIRLKVAQVEQLGGHGFIHCKLPETPATMVVQFEGQNRIHAGEEVRVAIPPASTHLFHASDEGLVIPSVA